MATSEKASDTLASENLRLRAQVAQLEDRLDHLAEQEGVSESLKRVAINQRSAERWHRSVMEGVSDVVLVATGPGVSRMFPRTYTCCLAIPWRKLSITDG